MPRHRGAQRALRRARGGTRALRRLDVRRPAQGRPRKEKGVGEPTPCGSVCGKPGPTARPDAGRRTQPVQCWELSFLAALAAAARAALFAWRLEPAARASSDVNWWALPLAWAARPPWLA